MSSTDSLWLNAPRYSIQEVLAVTGLRHDTLQTWTNREIIKLTEQNPGRGRRRLFSPIDVAAKLAPMRRMDDLKVALATSVEIAEAAAERLMSRGEIDWNLYLFLRPRTEDGLAIVSAGDRLAKFAPVVGDPRDMLVSAHVEWFEGVVGRRREKTSLGDRRPINPEKREALARRGIHAEPVIVFPLGEIVNGALAQLRAIDESEGLS